MPAPGPRLMVIVSERISEWIDKGEVVDRYYNPGEVFAAVDLVLTNDDDPDPAVVQRLVGGAEVAVFNVPAPDRLFYWTLGMRPRLVGLWARGVVRLAQRLRPDLVRCHGANVNAIAGGEVGRALGIPVVVSVHTVPDAALAAEQPAVTRLQLRALRALERAALRSADLVLPVYASIVPYLERLGVTRHELAYNVVGADVRPKSSYALHEPVRAITVGRLVPTKNPERLIRAVAELDGVELLVVGDGPLRGHLQGIAGERVRFVPAIPNAELCAMLAEQDVFAAQTRHPELPKTVLEATLAGLPVVLDERVGAPVPELEDGLCLLVEDTVEGYRGGLSRLVDDAALRESLGRRGREIAEARWAPERAEAHVADIYRRLLARNSRIPSAA